MSAKLFRLSPQASTRVVRIRAVPKSWCVPYASSEESGFLKAWLEDEASLGEKGRVNWGAISGLALSLVISAGFWMGMALIVERVLR